MLSTLRTVLPIRVEALLPRLVLALAAAALSTHEARAAFVVASSGYVEGTTTVFNQNTPGQFSQFDQTVGSRFTVGPADLTVTALGEWDWHADGLPSPLLVGLWDVGTGELLASVTVPAGTAGDLRNTDFRFVDLAAPLVLQSGRTYILADRRIQGTAIQRHEELQGLGNTPVISPDVTFQGAYNSPTSFDITITPFADQMPTRFLGGTTWRWIGPNIEYTANPLAVVPGPPALVLLVTGVLPFAGFRWLRRKLAAA